MNRQQDRELSWIAEPELYHSHTGSEEKHGKSEENIRGEAEDVF